MQERVTVRRLLHTREVLCRGYERDDGLFEIEGRLVDTKGEDTDFPYGVIAAGGVLHQMGLRMVIDRHLTIHGLQAFSEQAPTPACGQITAAYEALKGLRIGPGFKKQVSELVGGIKGCTHLTEMLGPMATTAIQTLAPVLQKRLRQRAAADPAFEMPQHWVLGTCHAYRPGSDAALRISAQRAYSDATRPPGKVDEIPDPLSSQ